MYFVSLGRHCCVAQNIKDFINNDMPTQFFDWARTDFKCVLHILNLRTIDTIFNQKNLIIDKEMFKSENNLTITLKNFVKDDLCLMYHHDIPYYNEDDVINEKVKDFISKYKRRHERLIDLINSSETLCFVYFVPINYIFDYNDCDDFNKIITSIKKDINYLLVLLIEDDNGDYKYIKAQHFIKINMKYFTTNNIESDWRLLKYDWKAMFDLIQTIAK